MGLMTATDDDGDDEETATLNPRTGIVIHRVGGSGSSPLAPTNRNPHAAQVPKTEWRFVLLSTSRTC